MIKKKIKTHFPADRLASTSISSSMYILNTSWTIEFQTELPIILMIKTKSYCFIVMSKLGCWLGPAASSSHWQDNGMDYWQWWKWIFPLHNEIWRKSMREREREGNFGWCSSVCVCVWIIEKTFMRLRVRRDMLAKCWFPTNSHSKTIIYSYLALNMAINAAHISRYFNRICVTYR